MRLIRRLLFSVALLFVGLGQPAHTVVHAATYDSTVRVQVIVEAKTPEGNFRDAIYYSKAEFDALSDAQVQADKAARVTAWVAAVQAAKTAPPPPEPTKAELQAQLDELTKQVADIQAKIAKAPVAPVGEVVK